MSLPDMKHTPVKTSLLALATALLAAGCHSSSNRHEGAATSSTSSSASAPGRSSRAAQDAARHERLLAELAASKKRRAERQARQQKLAELLSHFPPDHAPQREELIVDAFRRGLHDAIEWTTISTSFRGHEATIEVSTDAVKLHHVRVDVTAHGAQRIADLLGHWLPTPRVLQAIWEQADVRLEPCTLPADEEMATTKRMFDHSHCVDEKIGQRSGLVANVGKHWVLTNKLAGHPNLAANYGWFRRSTRPIQRVGTAHDTAHTDYSQVLRLVKRTVLVNGHPVDIQHVGRSHELWGLISDEGPLHVTRTARHGEEHRVPPHLPPPDALPTAPALAAGFSLSGEGIPIDPARLPDGMLAIKRHRLAAELADEARVPRAELPAAALVSRGAALCGHHDPFFELVSELDVDLDHLEQRREELEKGLACGAAVLDWVTKASAYEIHHLHEGRPEEFGVMGVPKAALSRLEGRIAYAPLDLAPAGVKRAWCFDARGKPRPHCPEGDHARVLLDVAGGTVAVHGDAWPDLVPLLNSTAPPPPKVARLVQLHGDLADHDSVTVADGPHCPLIFDHSLAPRALVETGEQIFSVWLAEHTDYCGRGRTGSLLGGDWHDVYLAKDEAAAVELERRLGQRGRALGREAHRKVADSKAEEKFMDTLQTVRRRLPGVARIERRGRRIDVQIIIELTAAEQAGVAAHVAERRRQVAAAARVVGLLQQGELPTAEQLAEASGSAKPR